MWCENLKVLVFDSSYQCNMSLFTLDSARKLGLPQSAPSAVVPRARGGLAVDFGYAISRSVLRGLHRLGLVGLCSGPGLVGEGYAHPFPLPRSRPGLCPRLHASALPVLGGRASSDTSGYAIL